MMKQENYKLNLQLSTVLLIQGAIPFVCVFLPIIVMALIVPAIFTNRDTYNEFDVQLMPKAALILMSLFPVINGLLTIFGIRPYRQFAKRLFGRIFCCVAMSKKSISPRAMPPMPYSKTIVPDL
ncbi:serpentine type 7TM GPCR chemoreceptor str domain-containing protein [Ditylenchus destructor]|nr:serpentine type 7TM GPCR chemoreceptor str domain-containing protein [Ditylenchus destructor]